MRPDRISASGRGAGAHAPLHHVGTIKETSMRIFITGASGWIGSAVVPELIDAGHQVLGLARSDISARAIADMGAEVLRGDLNDLDVLRTGALDSDGVIHLAFVVPSVTEAATRTDAAAIEIFTESLAGSGKPL